MSRFSLKFNLRLIYPRRGEEVHLGIYFAKIDRSLIDFEPEHIAPCHYPGMIYFLTFLMLLATARTHLAPLRPPLRKPTARELLAPISGR